MLSCDAQGLIAGVNAARRAQQLTSVTLPRNSSYIGTLLDDLVTKVSFLLSPCGCCMSDFCLRSVCSLCVESTKVSCLLIRFG